MTKIFFFATLREAAMTIRLFDAVVKDNDDSRYLFSEGEIVICGMGMTAAYASAVRLLPTTSYWINLGIAGCCANDISVGTAVPIGKVGVLEWVAMRGVYRNIPEEIIFLHPSHPAMLVTSPVPLYLRPEVPEGQVFVDMEGYALALAARKKNIPLAMIKVVSDFCTEGSHAAIIANIDALSCRLAEIALELCEKR